MGSSSVVRILALVLCAGTVASISLSSRGADGACGCLRWKDVYDHGMECGRGLEWVTPTSDPNIEAFKTIPPLAEPYQSDAKEPEEWMMRLYFGFKEQKKAVEKKISSCPYVYSQLHSKNCMKTSFAEGHNFAAGMYKPELGSAWHARSWCYVSHECTDKPNRTAVVPGAHELKVKLCQPGEDGDVPFAYFPAQDLEGFAHLTNVSLPHLAMGAYPVYPSRRYMNGTDHMYILPEGLELYPYPAVIQTAAGDLLLKDGDNSLFGFSQEITPTGPRFGLNKLGANM